MPLKIALIEDEEPIRLMYKLKLERENFEVGMAANGRDGLELAEKMQPDLLLLDLRMPVMCGDEMLAKLRETDWGSAIKVVVLTNISRYEAPQSLRLLNVDRYIIKAHYTPSQVVDVVKEVLESNRAAA